MQPIDTLYFICGTMRTGTTLLCKMFSCTPGAGSPREYLNTWDGAPANMAELAAKVRAPQPGPFVGFKAIFAQFYGISDAWGNTTGEDVFLDLIDALNPARVCHIYMHREDKLRQAVSTLRARTAHSWHLIAGVENVLIDLPRDAESVQMVEDLMGAFEWAHNRWQDWFAEQDIHPLWITYEDFTRSDDTIKQTFRGAAQFIGFDLNGYDTCIPLQKQAGQDVEDWIAWYHNGR